MESRDHLERMEKTESGVIQETKAPLDHREIR